jgi:alkylation response protein AidB-like acyl-CoA dehydrogenase
VVRANIGTDAFTLTNDIVGPYLWDLASAEQQERWLPGVTDGSTVIAVAMTEPSGGSDLRGMKSLARPTAGGYLLRGSKTFITSGIQADLVIVAAQVPGDSGRRIGLFAVETTQEGFSRGRKLEKIGRRAQDTAEMFFDEVFVPDENVIGDVRDGFALMVRNLPTERLSMAVTAMANVEHVLALTLGYVKERHAFSQPIGSFQANRFTLAELVTEARVGRVYVDDCILRTSSGRLSADEAAGVKYWATDLEWKVVDACLQLHGGYGYMDEYEIATRWRDARVQRIYGGTNELMKEIVGRALGL